MADSLKEIFEEAGEFAEANGNKLILADAVVLIAKANEIGAIIATMWDTEATDSIFDKYR